MADKTDTIKTRLQFDGEREYKENCAQISQNLKLLSSELKVATVRYADNGSSVDALRAKQDVLKRTFDEQKAKVQETAKALQAMKDAQGEDSDGAKRLEIALNKAKAEMIATGNQVKDLDEKMKNAGKSSSNFGEKIKSGMSGLKSGLATGAKAAGTAIAMVGTASVAAAAGVYKLAESASNLNEAQNVVQQTFKTSSGSIIKWTDGITATAGLGKTAATQMVGSMGAMMKSSGLSEQAAGDMSKKMVQLSGDMASFYNLNNEDAWEKIRSGISGETEPLKQLGINMSVANLSAFAMSQGITKSYNSMTQAEQTTLRYNYLMSVTKDAQGDFARTAGGMANQTRLTKENMANLAQTVGGKLLPSVNNMLPPLNNVLSTFTTFIATGEGSDKVTAAIKNLADGISKAMSDMLPQITAIMTSLADLIDQALPAILPQLLDVGVKTISALVTALVQAITKVLPALANGVIQLIKAATQILQQNGPMIIKAGIEAIMTLIQGLAQALPQLIQAAVTTRTALVNSLTSQLPTLIPVAVNAIITIVNGLIDNLPMLITAAIDIIVALIQGIMNALPQLIEEVPKIIIGIINGITTALPKLIDAAPKIIISIITGIINAIPELIKAAPKIIIALIGGLVDNLPKLLTMGPKILAEVGSGLMKQDWGKLGNDIIKGIVDGFGNIGSFIWGKIQDAGNAIVNGFKSFFGIHSPSTLMRDEIGTYLGLGVADGIQKTDFMAGVPTMVTNAKRKINAAMSGITGDVTGNININGTSQSSGADQGNQGGIIKLTMPVYLNEGGDFVGMIVKEINYRNRQKNIPAIG